MTLRVDGSGKLQPYRRLVYWMIPLCVPTVVQLALFRTTLFGNESVPMSFTVICFLYLFAWRQFCRAAYKIDDKENTEVLARHPTLARMGMLAFTAALASGVIFLGVAIVTDTGPYTHPVIWLLFMVWFLCCKEIIIAIAVTVARSANAVLVDEGELDR